MRLLGLAPLYGANAHALDDVDGSCRAKEFKKSRPLEQPAPGGSAGGRKLHCRLGKSAALLDCRATPYRQGRQSQGVEGPLQCAHRIGSQPEALRDALALLGKSQYAADRFGRRSAQQGIDAPTAARNAATATIKQDVALLCAVERRGQRALRLVRGKPRGHQATLEIAL